MSWHRPLSGIAKHLNLGVLLLFVATALHCKGPNIEGPEDMEEAEMSSESSERATADSEAEPSEPRAMGSVVGTVKVDGRETPGLAVEAAPELFGSVETDAQAKSTITGAGGDFSFSDLESDVFIISISNPMINNLDCRGVSLSAIHFDSEGQVKTLHINCLGSGTFVGTLRFSGGDRTHDPFVFSGGDGRDAKVNYRMGDSPDTIVIQGPAFAPSALPRLSGQIDPSGHFNVRGEGPIAGRKAVSVVATGRLVFNLFEGDTLEIDKIVVGGAGELPKETPINYEFSTNPPEAAFQTQD